MLQMGIKDYNQKIFRKFIQDLATEEKIKFTITILL